MRLVAASVAALCMTGGATSFQTVAPPQRVLYDANPSHLWNRIHEHFHVRVAPDGTRYGFDTVDPLLWAQTRYLLHGPSHTRAIQLLDEFLTSGGERLVADPLKRAVFQHDLWAVFDWLASNSEGDKTPARTALMQRVARVIRRVALTKSQIDALPDTYAAAVASGTFVDRGDRSQQGPLLPRDLFEAAGPWIAVGGTQPIAPQHAGELGRSAFIVLWSVPGGSANTAAYLRKLWDFPQPYVVDQSFQLPRDGELRVKPNPALPAVPDGTRIALVRKMMLIDNTGAIVPSAVVQSIQLRAFPGRQFSEIQMSRADLFAGRAGGLRMIGPDEGGFLTFSSKGLDTFERNERGSAPGPVRTRPVLAGCTNCHQVDFETGIETVRSLRQILRPMTLVDSHHDRWARYFPQTITAAEAKRRTYEWGVLVGLSQTQPR